jgi:acyl dehydratase
MLTTTPLDSLEARAGHVLGASDYVTITPDAVDDFAAVTGTVTHGYLVALAPALLDQLLPLDEFAMGTYGVDRLRFPTALPIGERVRLRAKLNAVDRIAGGATLHLKLRLESPDLDKPVCTANAIYRVYEQ